MMPYLIEDPPGPPALNHDIVNREGTSDATESRPADSNAYVLMHDLGTAHEQHPDLGLVWSGCIGSDVHMWEQCCLGNRPSCTSASHNMFKEIFSISPRTITQLKDQWPIDDAGSLIWRDCPVARITVDLTRETREATLTMISRTCPRQADLADYFLLGLQREIGPRRCILLGAMLLYYDRVIMEAQSWSTLLVHALACDDIDKKQAEGTLTVVDANSTPEVLLSDEHESV